MSNNEDYMRQQCEKPLSQRIKESVGMDHKSLLLRTVDGEINILKWIEAIESNMKQWQNKYSELCNTVNGITRENNTLRDEVQKSQQNAHEISDDGAKAWRRVDDVLYESEERLKRLNKNVSDMKFIGHSEASEAGFEIAKKYVLNMINDVPFNEAQQKHAKFEPRKVLHWHDTVQKTARPSTHGDYGTKVRVTCKCGETHAFEVG